MSTASTEPVISAAAGLPVLSQVMHVIREEVYKMLEETDSGMYFIFKYSLKKVYKHYYYLFSLRDAFYIEL
jgi:hypothetical protein